MKKIIQKYSLIIAFTIGILGCDVTDLEPENVISETLAFASPKNIELSMVGVYDAAQSGFYGVQEGNNRGYIFGAAHIQQGDMRGEDMLLINVFYDFTYSATISPTTANNVNYWENGFRIINMANIFIDGVRSAGEAGTISVAAAEAYEAEARVLRAMTYHTLVIHFARPYLDNNGSNLGLPIFTQGVNGADGVAAVVATGRNTVAEVYDFILDDLDFAESKLPQTRADGFQVTRATKGAAIALKTRVYLHMGDWSNVLTESDKLVSANVPFTGGGYSLGPGVDTPWANNNSTESIFGMEMSAVDNLNTNSALARMLGSPSVGARGEYAISPIIWNQSFWHADDLRRTLLTRNNGIRHFTHKFRDYVNWTDTSPIIRYAEVILNRAEAEARISGVTTKALDLLNAVRNRAIPTSATTMVPFQLADFANGNALIQAILNERRIELLAEGHRWSDIHRLATDPVFSTGGIPAKMSASAVASINVYSPGNPPTNFLVQAIPYSDHRFLWPLPQSEIARNPTLAQQQNPGY